MPAEKRAFHLFNPKQFFQNIKTVRILSISDKNPIIFLTKNLIRPEIERYNYD